jgi:hypothetical protein
LALVWEEYRQAQPEGYRYSRFCELYQRRRRKQEVVLRQPFLTLSDDFLTISLRARYLDLQKLFSGAGRLDDLQSD